LDPTSMDAAVSLDTLPLEVNSPKFVAKS
jgi:hypothetical protein